MTKYTFEVKRTQYAKFERFLPNDEEADAVAEVVQGHLESGYVPPEVDFGVDWDITVEITEAK